jgi:hypothetical protein
MKEIIYYRESAIQSIIADTYTFTFLVVLFAFNHFYLNDSKVVAIVFFIIFILFAFAKASAKKNVFTSKEALLDHVKGL